MPDAASFFPPFDFTEHVLARWTGEQLYDTFSTVAMAFLVAAACGWIGCYLILQGMALVGDAISHTVLLGIVVAFLVTGQITGPAIFIGAAVTGLVTTLLIEMVHSTSRVKEDAAIGIVFTSLFALGVVLLSVFAGRAHIDTQHVLYGNLELVALEPSVALGRLVMPQPVLQMAIAASLVLALIATFYKELLVVSFDPQMAASLGMRPRLVRYGMMAALSVTVVGAFNSVGAILVVAMLIAPAATAYLLTRRLPMMFLLSAIVGGVSALIGYHLSYWLVVSSAGAVVVVACFLFALAFFFAPEQGLVAAALRRLRLRVRMNQENIVRQVLKLSGGRADAAVDSRQLAQALGTGRLLFRQAVAALKFRGWIDYARDHPAAISLTGRGLAQAERLERAHRLWETYLVEQVGVASDHVHPAAEEVEHLLSEQLVERVDDALGHPVTDPHGAPIPRSQVSDQSAGTYTLSKLRAGDRARVVGLVEIPQSSGAAPAAVGVASAVARPPAAEPAGPTAQPGAVSAAGSAAVAALGLTLGQVFTVTSQNAERRSWTIDFGEGNPHEIPHQLADLVLVHLLVPPASAT
jgi:ABC-type Mn2+/Zn2+ transport system permease subunit/Mn-dependent DtxR family transcriptional regulator